METSINLDSFLAEKMYQHNLWWTYQKKDGKEYIEVSQTLAAELGREVHVLNDIMGKYATSLLSLKIDEAIKKAQDRNDDTHRFSRFVTSFETVRGKRSYQNQLEVLDDWDTPLILVTCVDITEMVELEREMVDAQGRLSVTQVYERQDFLEQQNKLIKDSYAKQSRFLALLSHELRSPLLGISSLVKRLRCLMDNSPEVDSMLKTISMTAEQSTYLVNDILTYTQTEYDGIKLHPTVVELSEILENVKLLTKSIANDKGLNLSVVMLTKNNLVTVDSVRLTQILINLIINGIKFTQYGGVNLEVKETQTGVYRFTISDSGEGIPQARLREVFEPFAQVDSGDGRSRKQQYLGAGLGLFVVKQLVELMGGEIKISSRQDVGTQFQFALNLSAEQSAVRPKKEISEPEKQTTLSGKKTEPQDICLDDSCVYKILVADDSEINRMVLTGYLAELKCPVAEAKDGKVAWKMLQEEPFDYVILDIQMPNMDGVEVARRLHEQFINGKQRNLRGVFAVTAGGESTGFENVNELLDSGAFDEWLVKPVSKKQIINLLKKDYRTDKRKSLSSVKPSPVKKNIQQSLEKENKRIHIEGYEPTADDIPAQFHSLIPAFVEEMNKNLLKLEELNEKADLEAIKKLAHYMKGNVMLFQLDELVELCKQLEILQDAKYKDANQASSREQKTARILQKIQLAVKSLEKS